MTVIESASRFTKKAEIYSRYRWDYSSQAIERIMEIAGLSNCSVIAEFGAGTGMLSKHFVTRVKLLYAIEPNERMRELAARDLNQFPSFILIDASAEETTLDNHSVDLIMAGRAIHWFDPEETRNEILRVVKPRGWLAILQVPCVDQQLDQAMKSIRTVGNGWEVGRDKNSRVKPPLDFFYGGADYQKIRFPSSVNETWPEFFGRLCSFSPAPDPDHPLYQNFEKAAYRIFQEYNRAGRLEINIATELSIGQLLGN